MRTPTALIMAGGTGGHVFPAMAVARVLRERGMIPVWLGTARGMESKLVPLHHIELELIDVGGVRGKGIATLLRSPFVLSRAVWQAMRVINKRKPLVVFGAGGFVSGPGGIAAWLFIKFGNWSAVFYSTAALTLLSAVLILVLRFMPLPKLSRRAERAPLVTAKAG